MRHNWRAEGRLLPCWVQIRGVQQTGTQTQHQPAKDSHIIYTSWCRIEILTLYFEFFGSVYQAVSLNFTEQHASPLYAAPSVQVQTASLGCWSYGQLMPRTNARFVYKNIWKQCRCIVNHCCKNNIQHWYDYYLITGNEKYLERVRYDLQALVWD